MSEWLMRLRTAFHEAGHAVVACALGIPVREAVVRDAEGGGGHVAHSLAPPFFDAAISVAGACAEYRHLYLLNRQGLDNGRRWQPDFALAKQALAGEPEPVRVLRAVVAAVHREFSTPRWWDVQRVAWSLMAYGRLTGRDVVALVDRAAATSPLNEELTALQLEGGLVGLERSGWRVIGMG